MIDRFKKQAIFFINNLSLLFFLLIAAFLIRTYHLSFPAFTSDEARIAYRGYTIITTGRDELGRSFPILFNSLEDYQLPVVSYLTAAGELIFGKSDFGARMPFIISGVFLVWLTFQIAKFFSRSFIFWLTSASVIAFSPPLIFLSKIPNETIVLTFLFALLFYLLVGKKNLLLIIFIMIMSLLTSRQAWLILCPFMIFTLIFYKESFTKNRKFILAGLSGALVLAVFILYLTIPQSKRSMVENNFSLFSSVTISNGINRLRGEGLQQGWPSSVERMLFNKGHFLTTGFLHWLSNISLSAYFGQFDNSGKMSYSYIGALAKVLLIPFYLGLVFLIRGVNRKNKLLLSYFLILTFPAFFIYPNFTGLLVLTLPFMALVISFGIEQLNKKIGVLILLLTAIEIIANVYFLSPEYKNTTLLRPDWVKELAEDIVQKSRISKASVSDDIVSDIIPFIQWYTPINPQTGFEVVPYPYKFRQYNLGNIKIVGFQEDYRTCGKDEKLEAFVSKRDLDKISKVVPEKLDQSVDMISKIYKDSNGEKRVYLTEKVCIK